MGRPGAARPLSRRHLVRIPAPLTTRDAMSIGTAGYTAMLAAMALTDNDVTSGDVLVTGASGGVGSFAVAILAQRGLRVVASTGKLAEADYLRTLGAAEVIDRAELSAAGKPLQKERWAGVIDSVGSHTLANACAQLRYGGVAVACGLAQGMEFPATVAPFILRGARLIGVDSVMCPMDRRTLAWQHLAQELDRAKLDAITREIAVGRRVRSRPRHPGGRESGAESSSTSMHNRTTGNRAQGETPCPALSVAVLQSHWPACSQRDGQCRCKRSP